MYHSCGVMINSIEGNIGSGKSTILSMLASRHDEEKKVECMPEPVAEWTNMANGVDLLKSFYQESQRWTFAFENLVQLSRLKSFYEAQERFKETIDNYASIETKRKNIFLERSLLSSYNVFILNSYEQDKLNKVEFDILTEYYSVFSERMKAVFDHAALSPSFSSSFYLKNNQEHQDETNIQVYSGRSPPAPARPPQKWPYRIIYLRTSPEVCYERIRTRNRTSESNISLAYLQQIHRKYEDWISRVVDDAVASRGPIVEVVDANQGLNSILKSIESFF